MDNKSTRNVEKLVGIAAIFCLAVGFAAVLVGIFSFFSGEYSAVGLNLIAAALSFSLFFTAVLRG